MAGYENRGNGSWRITIYGGYGPDGKQIRIKRTVYIDPKCSEKSCKRQLEKIAGELQTDYDRKAINDAKKLSFKKVYDDYIKDRIVRRGLAERTVDSYKDLFESRLLPAFGKKAIRDITAKDINTFLRKLAEQKLSGTYALKYFQQLNELFSYAQRSGIIVINPCSLVEPPKRDTKEAQYYEPEECVKIIKHLEECSDPKWRAAFSLAIYCGIRPGEMIGLSWKDYDGKNVFIQAGSYQKKGEKTKRTDKPKTKKSVRKITLTPEAIVALNCWKKAQAEYHIQFGEHWPEPDAIFTNDLGFRLRKDAPSKAWRRFTKKYGIRHLPLYDLRHTHCSLLISSHELSVEEVAARMGHEQTSTTLNIYSHAFANANERATEALTNVLSKAAGE